MVKTLPSNAGNAGSIPHQGASMPCSQEVKIYNRSNIAESSIDFKYGPHQKKKSKNKYKVIPELYGKKKIISAECC